MFESSISIEVLPDAAPASSVNFSKTDGFVRQHTLKNAINCSGIGLHSGARVAMTLRPAPVGSGIFFRRVDIAGKGQIVRAHWSQVSDTRLNTCIANEQGVGVRTIEHLMAALSGAGIDNVEIEINGPEVPVMDGSAYPFMFLIDCAGIVEQDAPRMAVRVKKPVVVEDAGKMVALMPSANSSVRVEIDFPVPAINKQALSVSMSAGGFRREISRARTFGFEQEVSAMHAAGLAKGGSLDNAVVISSDGERVLNDEGLRYEDEFVRHKTLDAIGDLYLAGGPLMGAYQGSRPGHALNNKLLRALFADAAAWSLEPMRTDDLDRAERVAPMALNLAVA